MSRIAIALQFTALVAALAAGGIVASTAHAAQHQREGSLAYLPNAEADSMLVVVELRDLDDIEYDRDVARTKRSAAEMREASARLFQTRAVTRIRLKEAEMDALEAKRDQAKSEKNDVARKQFEGERSLAGVEQQLLKRREQLRRNDIEFAKAEIEFYTAEIKAYELELDLARTRAQRVRVDGNAPSQERLEAAWRLDEQIREIEGKTLDAKSEAARKHQSLAKRAIDISKARKQVWEAQRKLISRSSSSR